MFTEAENRSSKQRKLSQDAKYECKYLNQPRSNNSMSQDQSQVATQRSYIAGEASPNGGILKTNQSVVRFEMNVMNGQKNIFDLKKNSDFDRCRNGPNFMNQMSPSGFTTQNVDMAQTSADEATHGPSVKFFEDRTTGLSSLLPLQLEQKKNEPNFLSNRQSRPHPRSSTGMNSKQKLSSHKSSDIPTLPIQSHVFFESNLKNKNKSKHSQKQQKWEEPEIKSQSEKNKLLMELNKVHKLITDID